MALSEITMSARRKSSSVRTAAPAGDHAGFLCRVQRTITEGRMLARQDRVLVAVSGGADSVALWRALSLLAEELSLSLAIVHINYHLRGAASDADERFCRKLAAQAGARIYVRSRRRPQRAAKSVNLQDWARRARYAVFETVADRDSFDRIAVGHHFDDQVETIAAGLFGGRESFALGGIPRKRGRVIRPLFDCRRAEILDFLRQIKQSHREDASNRDTRYLRNRLRHEILPELRQKYNPRLDETLFAWAEQLAEQSDYLEKTAVQFIDSSLAGRGSGWLGLELKRLPRDEPPLDFYLLREIARRLALARPVLGAVTLRRFQQLVFSGRPGQKLSWGAATIERSRTAILFYLRRPRPPTAVEILTEGSTGASNWDLRIVCRSLTRKDGSIVRLPRGARRFYGAATALRPPVVLRGAAAGEKIKPLGMSGHKKISDILAEAGVPGVLRSRAPVLADRRGVFWVVGHRQAARTQVTDKTRKILSIEVQDGSQARE